MPRKISPESIPNPAHEGFDLAIETPQELEEAKKAAGVKSHEQAMQESAKLGAQERDSTLVANTPGKNRANLRRTSRQREVVKSGQLGGNRQRFAKQKAEFRAKPSQY
jgi:hypothetical protein